MWSRAWIIKSVAVNLLSRLPCHEKLHFWGQKLLGKHELEADEMFRRASELFRLLRHVGGTVRDRRVLEIGTGWFPFVSLMGRLLGARRMVSVDVHPWLSLENVGDTVEALGERLDELARMGGASKDVLSRRYCRLQEQLGRADSARYFMDSIDVEYRCPCDITDRPFGEDSFDVVFSSNVLEHVPPDTLQHIHRETARMLDENGHAVHRFNPGDHYKMFTGNPCNFLKFSDRAWSLLGGYGLSYHNRLRSSDHARAAKHAGLNVRFRANRVDEEARKSIERGRLPLAPRFRSYSPADLAATYTWLVLAPRELPTPDEFPLCGDTLEGILQQYNNSYAKQVKSAARTD